MVGIVGIQVCRVSAIRVTDSTESVTRYDTAKQEAQSSEYSLVVG